MYVLETSNWLGGKEKKNIFEWIFHWNNFQLKYFSSRYCMKVYIYFKCANISKTILINLFLKYQLSGWIIIQKLLFCFTCDVWFK